LNPPDKKSHEGRFFISEEKTFMAGIFGHVSAAAGRHVFFSNAAASAAITG